MTILKNNNEYKEMKQWICRLYYQQVIYLDRMTTKDTALKLSSETLSNYKLICVAMKKVMSG